MRKPHFTGSQIVAVFIAWYIVLLSCPSPAQQDPIDRDFAEFLLGMDVVVDGTLVSADFVTHHAIGGCGMETSPTPATEMRVRVSSVVFGSADDSTIVVSTLGHSQFPNSALRPGAHVIAWGGRECTDSWRLWGNAVVVAASGDIGGDYNSERLFLRDQPRDRPMQYSALIASLATMRSRHSSHIYAGMQAVAVVRVREIQRISRGHFAYLCDSLGWVMGAGQSTPHRIVVNEGNLVCEWARVGDSLLMPVAKVPTDPMILPGCSAALLIKDGFAPGLGVPLTLLPHALKIGTAGLEVRPVISRE